MRIIAGSRARLTLLGPRDLTTRPITDRVKESLFAILQPRLPDALVADLFCGTGSLGLEALSRGARHALFVDADRDALDRLQKNLAHLRFQDQAAVLCADVFRQAIPPSAAGPDAAELAAAPRTLVLVDPPYRLSRDVSDAGPLGSLLARLSDQVASRALVVVRHERRVELLQRYVRLHQADCRHYGGMAVTFLERIDA